MSGTTTVTSDTTLTFSGSSGSGTIHFVETGSISLDCTYTITYTKQ
jgi:hypothetical protein